MCIHDHFYVCVYTQGLGTPTASQHNIFDSGKLSHIFLLLPTGFKLGSMISYNLESDTLPIESPVHTADRSTEDVILTLHAMYKHLDKLRPVDTALLLLEFSSAFNTIQPAPDDR